MDLSLAPTAISSIQSSAYLPSAACSFISTDFPTISLDPTATDASDASLLGTLDIEPHKGPWFDEQLPLIDIPDEFPQSWTEYRPLLDVRLAKLKELLETGHDEEFVKTFLGTYEEALQKLARKNGGQAYADYFERLKDLSELINLRQIQSEGISLGDALERLRELAKDTDEAVEALRSPKVTEMPTPIPDGVPALGANIGAMLVGLAALGL